MQRALAISAVAGLAAVGVVAILVQDACSQAPGRPVRAAVSSSNPTGQGVNNAVASDVAYGQRAGEGRTGAPTPTQSQGGNTGGGASGETSSAQFGRPNPGRPAYEDPEFRGEAQSGQTGAQNGEAAQGEDGQAEAGDEDVLTVAEGFFFDNYTSGSGFGVYGGEAVTSGQGRELNLPSAGVNARNLGLPVLPTQPVGTGQPVEPTDPPID